VKERTVSQATQLKAALAEISALRVVTPTDPRPSSGIVCVDTPEEPFALLESLREQGFGASVTPYSTRYLRLGPSIATTPAEVDAVVAALAELV
jgi:selenocysteine lyase/cysteine desulfurase